MAFADPIEAPAQLGETIGGYVLEQVLGSGAMGWVYGARHKFLGRKAAVKVLLPRFAKGKSHVSRLFNEARVVNDVKHDNVVDVFDFVMQPNPPRVAIIMELIEGPDLAQRLAQGPLPIDGAVEVVCEILDVLRAVHALGVVHRDLKPQNLMFTHADAERGATPRIKVLDFGIAKFTQTEVAHRTVVGSALGTPAYMAPEQAGGMEIGPKADVYAVGEILYEMCTGQRLFDGGSGEIRLQKRERNPVVVGRVFEVEPTELAIIIRSCLEYEPQDRPSVVELQTKLRSLQQSSGVSFWRRPRAVAASGAFVFLGALLTTVWLTRKGEAPPEFSEPTPSTELIQATEATEAIATVDVPAKGLAPSGEAPTEDEALAVADDAPEGAPDEAAALEPSAVAPVKRAPVRRSRRSGTRRTRNTSAAQPKPATSAASDPAAKRSEPRSPLLVEAWTTGGRRVAATVYVDGKKQRRKTPTTIKLEAGAHTIRIEPLGYPPQRETVRIPQRNRLDLVVDVPQ